MSKAEKILWRMRNNPCDWSIEDIKVIAHRFKIEFRQPGGSHVTFRALNKAKLTIPAHKPIHPIYIKKFIALLDDQEEL